MGNRDDEHLSELINEIWIKAFEQKRFNDALLSAFAHYLISRELKDKESERTAFIAMKGTIDSLFPENETEESCSFCGRRPPEVRLAAGPSAFICGACVSTLKEGFENK